LSSPRRKPGQPAEIFIDTTPEVGSPEEQTFQLLRAYRRRIADQRSVPAYVIFSDATLRHIANSSPRSLDELRGIPGMGKKKLAEFGDALLQLLGADPA